MLISHGLRAAYKADVIGGILVTTDNVINESTYTTDFLTSLYYDFTVPASVTQISAVAIGAGGGGSGSDVTNGGAGGGGGALSYANSISVTPGETLRVYVGPRAYRTTDSSYGPLGYPSGIVRLSDSSVLLKAVGGQGATASGTSGVGGDSADGVGDVKFSGSDGGTQGSNTGGGGGGTAGYSANGSTGLGGSGFFGGNGNVNGLGGGGVGVFGEGASGTTPGQGGSGGVNGSTDIPNGGRGGAYGAGGGGGYDESGTAPDPVTDYNGGQGAEGAVRIIWGASRSFPASGTSFAASAGNEVTVVL